MNQLIAKGRLRQADDGEVETLEAFWAEPAGELAPDLLVYADPVTSGDERNMEAARQVYAQRTENELA